MALAMVVLPDPSIPHIPIVQTSVDLFFIVRITSSTWDCNPTGKLVADKTDKLRMSDLPVIALIPSKEICSFGECVAPPGHAMLQLFS